MKSLSLFLLIMLSIRSYAQVDRKGNGGDGVICYTDASRNTINSVKLFDYWEQEQVQKFGPPDLGPSTLSVQEKIELAKRKIAKFDPNLAELIGKIALNLADNIQDYLVTSYILPEIKDSNPQVIPTQPNCFVEQFAIQYKDVLTGHRRFYISDLFYNHPSTSNDDKAGLLLHEAIYRHAILKNNANNSDGVRFLNYVVASKRIDSIDEEGLLEYLELLKIAEIYDESCEQKDHVFVKNNFKNSTCYNQVVRFGNIKVRVPANIETFRTGPSYQNFTLPYRWLDNPNNPQLFITVKNANGSQNRMNATHFAVGLGRDIEIQGANPATGSSYPQMYGPLNRFYDCEALEIDAFTTEIKSCRLADKNQVFFGFRKTEVKDQWLLGDGSASLGFKEGNKLDVLGSKKNLRIGPSHRPGYSIYRPIRVNSDLKLLSASIHSNPEWQTPININGQDHYMTEFDVILRNGIYVLSFTSTPKEVDSPKVRGLRVIDSSNSYNSGSKFCKTIGLDGGINRNSHTEYIGVKAEQFFDLAVDSIVYKTDEDVQIIDKITCHPKRFETEDY